MKKTCISKGWSLHSPHYQGPIDLPNDYSVTAPRDKNAPGGGDNGYFVGGTGRYHKELIVDALSSHYILDMDGAYMCATVYCNGYALVTHPHGYAPILVDLTSYIRSGENNTLDIVTRGLQPSTRWYSGAGVYRDVFLWQGSDIRIPNIQTSLLLGGSYSSKRSERRKEENYSHQPCWGIYQTFIGSVRIGCY